MTVVALALVLTSAFLHASWNLFAKRVQGGAAFTWLFALVTAVLYAPFGVFLLLRAKTPLTLLDFVFIAGSALIHVGYFLCLQRGYRAGDLSLVYPLARGTGPLLATVGAVLLLQERPSLLALLGTALIVSSVVVLAGGAKLLRGSLFRAGAASAEVLAVRYGLITGVFIAVYTLWDGFAVSRLLIAPLLFMWLSEVIRTALLTPAALTHWSDVRMHWSEHRKEVFGVAILSPLAYLLVLTALTFTPVSYVAPVREVSILIGTLLGTRLLAEGQGAGRLLAALGMVAGVVLLAFA